MNKGELFEAVLAKCEKDGGTKAANERKIQAVLDTIVETVAKGEEVAIAGFGTFKSIKKKATTARNIQTGATIKVPAKTVPKFVPGKGFKDAVAK